MRYIPDTQYFNDLNIISTPLIRKYWADYGTYRTVIWSIEISSNDLHTEEFTRELHRTDIWEPWAAPLHMRSKFKRGSSKILEDLCLQLEFKKREELIRDIFYSDPQTFGYYWMRGLDYYLTHAPIQVHILFDNPGYEMSPHKDNNDIIGQYIVNLSDNVDTTKFYGLNLNQIHKATGEKNKGTAFLNTSASVHTIERVTRPRYNLYFNLLQPLKE